MLRGIHPLLTGELLHCISDMGHGDTIVIGDGNFSSDADARAGNCFTVELWGYNTLEIVRQILGYMPLDDKDGPSVHFIAETGDEPWEAHAVWIRANSNLAHWARQMGKELTDVVSMLPRAEFHELARRAYAIVLTNDPTHYAYFALRKGALPEPEQVSVG
ncbi:hypothetical protein HYX70_00605 [Candidatus Saccharibacteria bacterium]|nr:hypothetical protein [Candidatus Saccharibacteria bacterium]